MKLLNLLNYIFFNLFSYKLLFNLFTYKLLFNSPIQKKICLYGDQHSNFFKYYFDHNILYTHEKKIYFFLIIKLILKFKKINFKNYSIEFINKTKPLVIITFLDNYPHFYELKKKFPNIKFVSIQNSPRHPNFFKYNLKKKKKYKIDYVLTWGDLIQKFYKSKISAKYITIGSIKNNHFKKNKKSKLFKSSLLFISGGYPPEKKYMYLSGKKKILNKSFWELEYKLLPLISNFCKKNKFKLFIFGKNLLNKNKVNKEFLFYKKILKNKFYYIENDITHPSFKIYNLSDKFNKIISMDSSFGLESLIRGHNTLICDVRHEFTKNLSQRIFWPLNPKKLKKNNIITNLNEKVLYKRMHNLFCLKLDKKNNLQESINNKLIIFDKNNKIFKKIIKELKNS